jgi:L,D-peptidoglycan transpeptidase YkuD (ErfK/YbiS/YcfS/YnhG family)
VVGLADDWNSSTVTLSLYERTDKEWKQVGKSWSGRLGRDGLAWGLGQHSNPKGELVKREGDWRAPAGVYAIGEVWGYDKSIRKHANLIYRQVTSRDLWVEDSKSKYYNQHLVLDHEPATDWEKQQQMKQGDAAHALKMFIAHNAPPKAKPGSGSSIFFHIWRSGGSKPTAGCTTMDESKLRWLIEKINPDAQPVYVLLTKASYAKYHDAWKLP